MLKSKPGNSKGFASVRRGAWTVMGDPTDPTGVTRALSVGDRFKVQTTGGMLYYGEKPPRYPTASLHPDGFIAPVQPYGVVKRGWRDVWDSDEMIQTALPKRRWSALGYRVGPHTLCYTHNTLLSLTVT